MVSSYMGKYLRISSMIRNPFLIYDFPTDPLWNSLYMKILFSFLSVYHAGSAKRKRISSRRPPASFPHSAPRMDGSTSTSNLWTSTQSSQATPRIIYFRYTVKRVDEVVRHPHLVTQDQFTQVSKKVSDIPAEDFTINIELFLQTFTNVELVQQNWIVSKATSTGREPRFSELRSDALPLRHTLFLI